MFGILVYTMNITNFVNFTPMKKVSYLKEVHVQGSFVVDTKVEVMWWLARGKKWYPHKRKAVCSFREHPRWVPVSCLPAQAISMLQMLCNNYIINNLKIIRSSLTHHFNLRYFGENTLTFLRQGKGISENTVKLKSKVLSRMEVASLFKTYLES